MSIKNIVKAYKERISSGASQYIPGRKTYYWPTDEYIFFIGSNTVFVKNEHCFIELSDDVFTTMINSYWRESKSDQTHDHYPLPEDSILGDDAKETIYDITPDLKTFSPEKAYLIKERSKELSECVSQLNQKRQDVINGLFFDHKTEKQLAEENGSSQQNIHSAKKTALKELARMYEELEEGWEL